MGATIGRLQPEGSVERCVNAYEKGLDVLAGELEMQVGSESFRIGPDDYALIPFATTHALRNAGREPARWFEMAAPQPQEPGRLPDTVFWRRYLARACRSARIR